MPPVKEIRQCEEGEECIARRHTLDKAGLVWHRQVNRTCIDKGEDVGSKQRDGDPDNEPEAIIGTAIGQQGDQPHEVLRAEYFTRYDEDQQDRDKCLGNIQLTAPLHKEGVEVAKHKQGIQRELHTSPQRADNIARAKGKDKLDGVTEMGCQEEDWTARGLYLHGAIGEVVQLAQHSALEIQQREEAGDSEQNSEKDDGMFPAQATDVTQRLPEFCWERCQSERLLWRVEALRILSFCLFRDEKSRQEEYWVDF